jgi:prevent-host-death family protein
MAANPIPAVGGSSEKTVQVNLYEAKTQLSSLVERAAKGEEIVIAKAGKPMARLVAVKSEDEAPEPLPFGQNLLGIEFLSEDWDKDLPPEWFEGDEEDPLLVSENSK